MLNELYRMICADERCKIKYALSDEFMTRDIDGKQVLECRAISASSYCPLCKFNPKIASSPEIQALGNELKGYLRANESAQPVVQ